MRKALIVTLSVVLAVASLFLTAISAFYIVTAGCNLQPEKLIDYTKTISVYDDCGNKIEDAAAQTKKRSVSIDELSDGTVNAFIASEDRNFFKHNGLNYKRMAKALYKNVASRSFKEGASTISQQLIKNTHLSGDKTIKRKLKEIKLTRQLERRYDKRQILEMYLNTIYFGHNCFGLQSAANFYFGKPADELTLNESATVVGLLTSPNNFSPFKNPEKCVARRNVVLKNMLDCGYIDKKEYKIQINLPLAATEKHTERQNTSYLNAVFDELEALNLPIFGQMGELKIKTFFNEKAQKSVVSATEAGGNHENGRTADDYSVFIRNSSGGVVAFHSSIGLSARQIGSTAKPIFVYAPAINDKKINIFTKISDEPINYGGYSPENYDKKYHGKVTVEESIAQSLNVPAVKTLNTLNLDSVQAYAAKMGVNLCDEDKNLSLALGGMKSGLNLKQLCDCYSVFPNDGNYSSSHFIDEICDKSGKIIYKNEQKDTRVFSRGTCSLITEALIKTAKSGTAKKLADLNFDVACKTGTCGTADGNTDAYSVAYTSDLCVGVWLGSADNKKSDVTGGRDCCKRTKEILNGIYNGKTCAPLDKTGGTKEIEIDREEYEQNDKIIICDPNSPKLNRLKVKCLEDNAPKEQSDRFSTPSIRKPAIIVSENKISIELCQTKYYSYLIKRINNGKITTIYDGAWQNSISDEPADGEYVYTVTPYYDNGKDKFYGEEIQLPRVIVRQEKNNDKIPDIAFKDWYNK